MTIGDPWIFNLVHLQEDVGLWLGCCSFAWFANSYILNIDTYIDYNHNFIDLCPWFNYTEEYAQCPQYVLNSSNVFDLHAVLDIHQFEHLSPGWTQRNNFHSWALHVKLNLLPFFVLFQITKWFDIELEGQQSCKLLISTLNEIHQHHDETGNTTGQQLH